MNPIRAWNTFWFGPISGRPLGAFRIVFGLVLLANLGFLAFDLDYWYTNAGILQGNEAREVAGPLRGSVLFLLTDPVSVRIFFGATAAAIVLFTVGWHTRVMGVLVYLATMSLHHRNVLTNSGADALVTILTFYAMLAPCGACFSIDAWRAAKKRGTAAEPLIIPWAQRLIQLQVAMIYVNTAILKGGGSSWLNGTAIHYVLSNTEVGRPWLTWLTEYPIIINLMTHGALVVEFSLAFLLWFRSTRRWMMIAGLGLHASIVLTVNIPIFGEAITATYLLFLSPVELNIILKNLNPRNWFVRQRTAVAPLVIPGRVDRPEGLPAPHVSGRVRHEERTEVTVED